MWALIAAARCDDGHDTFEVALNMLPVPLPPSIGDEDIHVK